METPSFNFRDNRSGQNNQNQGGNKASEKQISFYNDLCRQRNMTPDSNHTNWTYQEMSNQIQKLLNYYPASKGQKDKIIEMVKQLQELGVNEPLPSNEELNKLEGGYEGSASKRIRELQKKIQKNRGSQSQEISEGQLNFLVSMFLCPDVDFENEFHIKRTKEIKLENGQTHWRYLTPQEFSDEIKQKMSRQKASKFIDKYRGAFFDWRRSRVTANQECHIKRLELRVANVDLGETNDVGFDKDGNIAIIHLPTQEKIEDISKYNDYFSYSDLQIKQLSKQEASKMIDMLQSELDRMSDINNFPKEKEEDREGESNCLQERLKKVAHRVEVQMGYEDEKLHEELYHYAISHDEKHLTYIAEIMKNEDVSLETIEAESTEIAKEVKDIMEEEEVPL